MSTNIPAARHELLGINKRLRRLSQILRAELGEQTLAMGLLQICDQIDAVVSEKMTRKVNHANARTVNRKVTGWHVREVLRIKKEWPSATYQEIAGRVGIGAGRVSEIINGLRTEANPSMATDGMNREIAKNG